MSLRQDLAFLLLGCCFIAAVCGSSTKINDGKRDISNSLCKAFEQPRLKLFGYGLFLAFFTILQKVA